MKNKKMFRQELLRVVGVRRRDLTTLWIHDLSDIAPTTGAALAATAAGQTTAALTTHSVRITQLTSIIKSIELGYKTHKKNSLLIIVVITLP